MGLSERIVWEVNAALTIFKNDHFYIVGEYLSGTILESRDLKCMESLS